MGDVYRNYKLSSGDEVIGKLVGRNTRTVVLNRPMMVKTITLQDPMSGEQKDIMIMRPWASMTNELDQKIPVRHIIVETSPTPDVVGLDMPLSEEEEPQQDEDNVQMNFQIPPGLFLGFLMNGIVSLDPQNEGAEFDIDEFMKMKNEGNSKRKPRRKNKEIEDYFRDWTPEP